MSGGELTRRNFLLAQPSPSSRVATTRSKGWRAALAAHREHLQFGRSFLGGTAFGDFIEAHLTVVLPPSPSAMGSKG
jgi:hypothetical protein